MIERRLSIPQLDASATEMLNSVPDVRYKTQIELNTAYQELADQYPNYVKVDENMQTGEGRRFRVVTVGDVQAATGGRPAGNYLAMLGVVDPNEIDGTLTALQMAEWWATNDEYRRYFQEKLGLDGMVIVPVADPDWFARNHGWLRQPTYQNYAHFGARQPMPDRVEMGFTLRQPGYTFERHTREAANVEAVLETYLPSTVLSLHGSKTGGAYLHSSIGDERFCTGFSELVQSLGLDVNTTGTELTHLEQYMPGTGVYPPYSGPDWYQVLAKRGAAHRMQGGATTFDVTATLNPNARHVLTEIPVSAMQARRPHKPHPSKNKQEIVQEAAERQHELVTALQGYAADLSFTRPGVDTALHNSAIWHLDKLYAPGAQAMFERAANTKAEPATNDFAFSVTHPPIFARLIHAGSLERVAAQAGNERVAAAIGELINGALQQIASEGLVETRSLRENVIAQLGVALLAAQP